MDDLSGKQRKYLRGLAHKLNPAVTVGKNGLNDGVYAELERALDQAEVVKVRFADFKDERKELAPTMAEKCGAVLAGLVGHTAIFYRRNPDPEKRNVKLP